jgi:hypothetical protein
MTAVLFPEGVKAARSITRCNVEVKNVWNFALSPHMYLRLMLDSDKFLFLRDMRSSGVLQSVEW